jgi:hypothetical protein
MSGLQNGGRPNVQAPFRAAEPGRYVVDVFNLNPAGRVEYQLKLTG